MIENGKTSRAEILAILVLLATFLARAHTFYVATNGLDSNPGTQIEPWLTIQKGLNTVQPGDTLMVGAGHFTLSSASTKTDGTQAQPIVLQGAGGSGGTNGTWLYVPQSSFAWGSDSNTIGPPSILVSNSWYIVRGFNCWSNYILLSGNGANHNIVESNWLERGRAVTFQNTVSDTNGPAYNIVQYNVFTNMYYCTAAMGLTGTSNLICNNTWNLGNDNDAIDFFGLGNVISNNLWANMSPSAEHSGNHIDMCQTFGEAGHIAQNIIIEDNVMTNSAGHFFIGQPYSAANGGFNDAVSNIIIRNNLIVNSVGEIFNYAPDVQILNNTFYIVGGPLGIQSNGVPSIWIRAGSPYGWPSNCVVLNNIIADSSANVPLAVDAAVANTCEEGYNFISGPGGSDPWKWTVPHPAAPGDIYGGYAGFVSTNLAALDLRLAPDSVCSGTGTNILDLVPTDILGEKRTLPMDMGAYNDPPVTNTLVPDPPSELRIISVRSGV